MPFELPNEQVAVRDNARNLASQLANAEELYLFSMNLPNKSLNYRDMPGIDRNVLWVTSGLFTKACRMYRCVYLQLLHGLVPEVEVSLRCLYETTVTLIFLLKPRISLPRNHPRIGPVPRKPLTTRFRSRLYQAHVVFDALEKVHELQNTSGSKRFGKLFDRKDLEARAKNAERELGPEWTKRLKSKRNCFGMSLRQLACLIKQEQVYMRAYYFMSKVAHARDGLSYLVPGAGPDEVLLNFEADTEHTPRVSGVADLLMYDCCTIINLRYRLGQEKEMQKLFRTLRLRERAEEQGV